MRILLLSLLAATLACTPPGEGKTAYVGMELWDGTGAPLILDAVMIVAQGRIEEIGPPDLVKVPRGAVEVRLDGRWVIPGLIDAHAHVSRASAPRFLAAGVTALREMGGPQAALVALRQAIDEGGVDGPRLYLAGAPIDGVPPTWPFAQTVRVSGEARRAVGDRVLIDASQLSVGPRLSRQLLEVLLDEARALETPVAIQLDNMDALAAARLGVGAIELLTGLGWTVADSQPIEQAARTIAQAGVAQIPALVRRSGTPGAVAAQDLFLRRFRAAGGVVGAGTDAGVAPTEPGAAIHRELALLVAAGFSAEEALLAATRDGARLVAADSLGTLATGMLADFVVLTGNPLADIANVARVERVFVAGQAYDPATLRGGQ